MLAARDALKENPGANGKKVRKRAKTTVVMADAETRLKHAKSLRHQGEFFRSVEDGKASSAWSSAVLSLPPEQLKFALNASQDTYHNVNLARWRNLSASSKLCGQRQTLQHVHCSVALELRCYNTQHDGVLDVIHTLASSNLPSDYQVVADLPDQAPFIYISTSYCHHRPLTRPGGVEQYKAGGDTLRPHYVF